MCRLSSLLVLLFSCFIAQASVTLPVAPPATYPGSWQQQPLELWQQQQRQFYLSALLAPARTTLAAPQRLQQENRGSYQAELWQIPLSRISHSKALLLRPLNQPAKAAVLLLHGHGAYFVIGKEKMIRPFADSKMNQQAKDWVDKYYSGVFIGDELAKQGYLVLAADTAGFGERGPLQSGQQQQLAANLMVTGHSLAGLAAYEDMQLARFLAEQNDVPAGKIAAIGFSMGAYRAWLQKVWQAFGAESALRTEIWTEARHEFNQPQQLQVWSWLEQWRVSGHSDQAGKRK